MKQINRAIKHYGTRELKERILRRVKENRDGCWKWTGQIKDGYGMIKFTIKCDAFRVSAHKVSYALWKGAIPKNLLVRHYICGNRDCVNPEHLRLGTARDNAIDTSVDNNLLKGKDHPHSKVTPAMVRKIRKRAEPKTDKKGNRIRGESALKISYDLPIGDCAVRDIINRKTWKHIK